MEEIQTHNISSRIVDLANGELDMGILMKARERTKLMDFSDSGGWLNPTGDGPVLRILGVIARHVLDQAIKGMQVVYGEHVSFLGFDKENGLLVPKRFDSTASFSPLPGFDLGDEDKKDVQVAYRMFGGLIEGGALSPERIGKCHCGRYFLSVRLGLKKSRACSKAHQAVLTSRESRFSSTYLKKENERNACRMAAVREGKKLMIQWNKEGKSHSERTRLLWKWNEDNGAALGIRGLNNILEKGV